QALLILASRGRNRQLDPPRLASVQDCDVLVGTRPVPRGALAELQDFSMAVHQGPWALWRQRPALRDQQGEACCHRFRYQRIVGQVCSRSRSASSRVIERPWLVCTLTRK